MDLEEELKAITPNLPWDGIKARIHIQVARGPQPTDWYWYVKRNRGLEIPVRKFRFDQCLRYEEILKIYETIANNLELGLLSNHEYIRTFAEELLIEQAGEENGNKDVL